MGRYLYDSVGELRWKWCDEVVLNICLFKQIIINYSFLFQLRMSLSKPVYNFLGFYFQQLHTNPVITKSITRLVREMLIVSGIRHKLFDCQDFFFFSYF